MQKKLQKQYDYHFMKEVKPVQYKNSEEKKLINANLKNFYKSFVDQGMEFKSLSKENIQIKNYNGEVETTPLIELPKKILSYLFKESRPLINSTNYGTFTPRDNSSLPLTLRKT